MNRQTVAADFVLFDVPRTCGDEPAAVKAGLATEKCSPHVRG